MCSLGTSKQDSQYASVGCVSSLGIHCVFPKFPRYLREYWINICLVFCHILSGVKWNSWKVIWPPICQILMLRNKVSLTVQEKSRKKKYFSIISLVVLHVARTCRIWYYQAWSICSYSGRSQSTSQLKVLMQLWPSSLKLWSLGTENFQNQTVKLITSQDRQSRRNNNLTESFEWKGIWKEKIYRRSSIAHRWLRKKIIFSSQDIWVRECCYRKTTASESQ